MTNVTNKEQNKRRQLSWNLSFTGLLILLLFRIPLTNIIGNEGNGFYFISFEIFTIFYIIFGFTFHKITYELIRKYFKKYSQKTKSNLLAFIFIIGIFTSILGSCILFISSKKILSFLQMELSIISLRLLCVYLIVSTILGILRGYFEGMGSSVPTSFSKIIEAIVAGTASLIFASSLYKYGTKVGDLLFNQQYQPAFGATGIICGFLCGSIFSFLFLFLIYQFFQRRQKQGSANDFTKEASKRVLLLDIIKVYFISLTTLLFMYSYRLVNTFLYVFALKKQNQEDNTVINILSLIGSYHGKVLVLIGIIILVILSLCGKNISRICKNHSRNAYEICLKYTLDEVKQIAYFSVPSCILFVLFSEQILNTFYGKANLTEINFLKIESLCIILIPFAMYLYRLMHRLNFNLALLLLPIFAFAGQSVVMYVLVNTANAKMLSIVIAEVVFWFLLCTFEFIFILKEFKN